MCQTITRPLRVALSDAEYAALMVKYQRYVFWLWRKWDEQKTYGAYRLNADDVVQETNLLLWRRRGKYDPSLCVQYKGEAFVPWVKWAFRSAIGGMRDKQRRRAKRAKFVPLTKATRYTDPTPPPYSDLERTEARPLVRRAVASLPRRSRSRVIRNVFQGQTQADIGRMQGVTREAIRIDIVKAFDLLRGELESIGP